MKVNLISTWNTNCGLAYYSKYLVEELKKLVDVDVVRVDPSFSAQQFLDAAEHCDGDIAHFEHAASIYRGQETGILRILNRKKVKTVLTAHGGDLTNYLGIVDRVIALNKTQCGAFSERILSVIPCGATRFAKADKDAARKELGVSRKYVVTQWGFILPHKQYEAVLGAIRDMDDVTYLIAGSAERDPNYGAYLRSLVRNMGVKAEVIETGFLPEEKLPTVFGATDLAIFPYKPCIDSACLRYALGSGVPCLASAIPFVQELAAQYGVPYMSPLSIRELLEKPNHDEYLQRCERFAEETSWANIAKQHVTLYEQILELKK